MEKEKRLSLVILDNKRYDEMKQRNQRSSHNLPNLNLLHSSRSRPKTNLEKVIESLYDIKDQFVKLNNKEYTEKVNWVINEVNSNKMYYYAHESSISNTEESKYLSLYSPDFDRDKDYCHTVKHSKTNLFKDCDVKEKKESNKGNKGRSSQMIISINNKPINKAFDENLSNCEKTETQTGNLFVDNNLSSEIKKPFSTQCVVEKTFDKLFIKPLNCKDFGVNFDVFSYADEVGRVFMLWQISLASFAYNDIYTMLNISYLENYIEELRLGYTSQPSAYYHNVSKK